MECPDVCESLPVVCIHSIAGFMKFFDFVVPVNHLNFEQGLG